jgi:hypothetical protein
VTGTPAAREKRFIDDLPAVHISRLRALGVVTADMQQFTVALGDVTAVVGVSLLQFPNGGSWSFFVCPTCGKSVRTLRSLNGVIVCKRCCVARGVRYRCEPTGARQRAAMRAPKLFERLNSEASLRLKPHLWGTMERRSRYEETLQRNLAILRRADLAKLAKAIDQRGGVTCRTR